MLKGAPVPRQNTFLAIEPFDDFGRILDPAVFRPVADAAFLGLSDVVNSTAAIASGRYKAVNMAGAAVISAVMNALHGEAFPFVFGGDGASFVVEPAQCHLAKEALAACAAFAREEFDLELRIAMIPVRDIRASVRDLRVARFAPSPSVAYAMFSGGGIEWASAADEGVACGGIGGEDASPHRGRRCSIFERAKRIDLHPAAAARYCYFQAGADARNVEIASSHCIQALSRALPGVVSGFRELLYPN
jgi:hypothetical protein